MLHLRVAVAALVVLVAGCGSNDSAAPDTEPDGGVASTASAHVAAPTADVADASSSAPTSTTPPASDVSDDSAGPVSEDDPVVADDGPSVAPASFPLAIDDAVGRELVLEQPARIGCFWTGCTEIHADLGIPPAAAPVPGDTPADGPFYFPAGPPEFTVAVFNDLEAWAGADIDFVANRGPQSPNDSVVEQFVEIVYLHAPGLTDTNLTGYDAHIENLRIVGQLLGLPAEAEAAVDRLETAIANLGRLSTPELAGRSFAYLFNGPEYRLMTDDTPFCAAIADAAVATCVPLAEGEIAAEEVLSLDPDIIAMQSGAITVATRDDPTWARLSAVQEGAAYDSDDRLYWCCGPRSLIWALQDFAAYAIPDSPIPAPGPLGVFDPLTSPLVTGEF